jgi:hypothetical protein
MCPFAVYKDIKSYTSVIITLGNGAIISNSVKQIVNRRSSTKSEMVAANDTIIMVAAEDTILKILWTT